MATSNGITAGQERSAGITTGQETTGGIKDGQEPSTGITTGQEAGGITTGNEGNNDIIRYIYITGSNKLGGYALADTGVPADRLLALMQTENGTWTGYALQESGWEHVFQTNDWRVVLSYASDHDLLIKHAYTDKYLIERCRCAPLPASSWGWTGKSLNN